MAAGILAALCGAGAVLPAFGQSAGIGEILEALDREGRMELPGPGVVITRADFTAEGDSLEAILFRPSGEGDRAAVYLIPGFPRTARDVLPLGVRFAGQGLVVLAVTMPGFGRSGGVPDYCGPATLAALETGLARLYGEEGIDTARVVVYGIFRGATAAAQLAVRPHPLRAAILAAGIYDLGSGLDGIKDDVVRANIRRESGLDAAGSGDADSILRARSPLADMDAIACPVLILHGGRDPNAPVAQAELLRGRLTELEKPFEIRIFPDLGHDLGMANLTGVPLEFLKRQFEGP